MENWKIELANVNYVNNGFSIKEMNLKVKAGTITGVIGKNGSGKSTLLRLIHGDIKPQHGRILIDGDPVVTLNGVALARKISLLYQEMHDPLNFTVGDVLSVSAYSREVDDDSHRLLALEELGVGKYLNKNFNALSGGEKRLVTIASSIYQDSEIMLFDEPTAYLDIDNQILVLRILNQLRNRGKTVIVVMHELNAINSICDNVVMLRDGEVVASGKVQVAMTPDNLRNTFNVHFNQLQTVSGNLFYPEQSI